VAALEGAVAEQGAVSLQLKARVGDQGEYEKRGYDVVLFDISKPVAGVPPTVYPDAREVQLRPMTQEQFDAYARDWQGDLAAHLTESTDASPEVALESARGQFEQLAHGPLRPRKQAFLVGYHEDEPIGRVWIVLEDRPDGLHAFVNDLRVDSTIRGKGFGRSLMAANYQHLRDIGVVRVRGRVYGANQHALAIFERADYRVTDVHLKKEVSPSN
jgi:GNAT superfamily N-acetyltransferase